MMKWAVEDKTNTKFFIKFLKYICAGLEDPRHTVIILDNHTAHKSIKAKNLAAELGITLHFLPPTASELNPIERMWSYFKAYWRTYLAEHLNEIHPANIDHHLEICLGMVAHLGTNLSRGPLREMVLTNQGHRL